MNKKDLSECDNCTRFITQAIDGAGWDIGSQIREQDYLTKGRVIVRGRLVTRATAKFADYVLYYKPNIPNVVLEAKDNDQSIGSGMRQAQQQRVEALGAIGISVSDHISVAGTESYSLAWSGDLPTRTVAP